MSNYTDTIYGVLHQYLRWCTAIEEVVDDPFRGKWFRMTLGEEEEDIEFKLVALLDTVSWKYEVIDKLIELEDRLFDRHLDNILVALSSPLC